MNSHRPLPLARLALAALPLVLAGPARAQDGAGNETAPSAPPAARSVLRLHFAGLDALLVDERDAGLRRALGMLDERLLELPAELEGEVPEPVLALLCDLAGPFDLDVRLLPPVAAAGVPPVEVELQLERSPADGESLARHLEELLVMLGIPSQAVPDSEWEVVPTPQGAVYHGPLPASTGRTGRFVSFGEPELGPPVVEGWGLPEGVEPGLTLAFDAGPVQPFLDLVLDMAGPRGDVFFEVLDRFGLMSEDPLGYRYAQGMGTDRSHAVLRTVNGVEMLRSMGWYVAEPLSPEELRMVPEDAVMASVWKGDMGMLAEFLTLAEDLSGEDLTGRVRDFLGIDPRTQLLDLLGDFGGLYTADSTGGGGVTSLVAFLGVEDEAAMLRTVAELGRRIDAAGQGLAKGYVGFRAWDSGGTQAFSLRFPGLPIPAEPSVAVAAGAIWMAATPQALSAALAHARSGEPGLVASERFRAAATGSLDDLCSLGWQDVPRMARDGYAFAALATTALANAVRSPRDREREPGVVLPPFAELLAGARPTVMLGRIEGEDVVVRGEGDRSCAVNLAAVFGNPMLVLAALGSLPQAIWARTEEAQAWEAIEPLEPGPYDHDDQGGEH